MSELKNAERLKTKFDLNYNPNVEQLTKPKTEFSPEITGNIYCSLDREKRKASRDKGQYDASNVSYKSEAIKLKDS